jgi:hypothetical protein
LGIWPPKSVNFVGIAQKFDDFLQFDLGLIHSGHILEGDAGGLLLVDFGLAFAQGHEAGLLRHHFLHQEEPDPEEDEHRQEPGNNDPAGRSIRWCRNI